MEKMQVVETLSNKIKLVRVERDYSQDKMAEILGMSKKTLVQIEKGRQHASWASVVTLCALFRDSEILQQSLGNDPLEVLELIAHESIVRAKDKTLGGRVWWKEIVREKGFIVQQNMISQHYRILDEKSYRYFSSFDKTETLNYLNKLVKEEKT